MPLAQDLMAAGIKPDAYRLLFGSARDAQSRRTGGDYLTAEQQVGAARRGLNTGDIGTGRARWNNNRWEGESGGEYVAPDHSGTWGATFARMQGLDPSKMAPTTLGELAAFGKVGTPVSRFTEPGTPFTRTPGTATPFPAPTGGAAPTGGGVGDPTPLPATFTRGLGNTTPHAPATSVGTAGFTGSPGTRNVTIPTATTTTTPGSAIPRGPGAGNPGSVDPVTGAPLGGGTSSTSGDLGYGFDIAEFLDPSMAFRLQRGADVIEQSAAAGGSLMSGDTLRALEEFAQGLASTEYGAAWNRGADRRNFEFGADTADRAFDYGVHRDDRAFEMVRLGHLASLGSSSAAAANSGSTVLAGILAQILGNRGNIEAGGAIGGSNAINASISQILAQIFGNQLLGTLKPGGT